MPELKIAQWRVDGPAFDSREDTRYGERVLGTDYCVPGNTRVESPSVVTRVWRRPFTGELLDITTASGKVLSATPNHPVLTRSGWIAAEFLNEGDDVFGYAPMQRAPITVPDSQHVMPTIEEVFRLADKMRDVPGGGVRPVEFDGDPAYKDVDVIAVDGFLWDRMKAVLFEPSEQVSFTASNTNTTDTFNGGCVASSLSIRSNHAASTCLNLSETFSSNLRGHVIPHTLSSTPQSLAFSGSHVSGPNLSSFGTSSTHVGPHTSNDSRLTVSPQLEPESAEILADRVGVHPVGPGKRQRRLPSYVTPDKIIGIERRPFVGHVYNLSTVSQWFVCDGIITHNCTNCDNRFGDLRLGPKINTVELTTVGGTAANTNGIVRARSIYASAEIVLVFRGTDPAAVRLSDWALSTDPAIAFASRALSPLYTKNAAGTQEISVCLAGATYRVVNSIAGTWPTVTITETACTEAITNQCMFEGWADFVMGGGGQVIRSNELTGSVGMDASAWATRETLTGEAFTFTAGATYGKFAVYGTTNGPYAYDTDWQGYRPIIPELNQDSNGCLGMKACTPLQGILVPFGNSLWLVNETKAQSVGLDQFLGNYSPIRGRCTAICTIGDAPKWILTAWLDPLTADTTLCYARRPVAGEPEVPLVYFPVATLTDTSVECMEDLGKAEGIFTNPVVVLGHNDDMAYITHPRTMLPSADTNYLYSASGTWYGTTMERIPVGKRAKVHWVSFTSSGNDSSYKVQAALSMDGRTATNIGNDAAEVGSHWFRPSEQPFGRTIKPQLTLTGTAGGTSTPVVKGMFEVAYEIEDDPKAKGF